MKVIKADLEVPFWCSFSEYGTVNIRPTYPFPPPTTLFGLIQNALQKPALHNLNKESREGITRSYLENYSKLHFAIIIKENGEKIDDYLNIHKGSRLRERKYEDGILTEKVKDKIKSFDLSKEDEKSLHKIVRKITRKKFVEDFENKDISEENEILSIIHEKGADELVELILKFWHVNKDGVGGYETNKNWEPTQINHQRLVGPKYTIYIHSSDQNGEYSLENIYYSLKNPKRPLYLGESDDVVNVGNVKIIEMNDDVLMSSKIDSVIPGVYTNSQLVKIPLKLKNDIPNEEGHNLICSIPQGELEERISCFESEGENIVFLRSDSKE
ncbi:MAG: CRISPR-associated protein Cas5 [Methanobacterium sp.]|nr:MAG: CRISPR-associated protein Cas5 [Methanobacterium sp.]